MIDATFLSLHQEQAELPGGIAFLKHKNRQAARRVVSTGPPACGWLRGTSRTSPGPPRRWRRPVRLQSISARGRGFAAYLSGCARQPFIVRCAHYARGASLSTFGFVTIVPRYLLPQVIPSHSFAALTALIVRRVKGSMALLMYRIDGLGDQPQLACTSRRTPPGGALAGALGSGTLPHALIVRRVKGDVALFVRRVNGVADRPMLRLY